MKKEKLRRKGLWLGEKLCLKIEKAGKKTSESQVVREILNAHFK